MKHASGQHQPTETLSSAEARRARQQHVHKLAALDPDERLADLKTSRSGLTDQEASRRLARYGSNSAVKEEARSTIRALAGQFTHTLALLLWFASGLAFAGDLPELALAIIAVICINGLFAFAQEYRGEQLVRALSRQVSVQASVERNGRVLFIPAEDVVPGDVIHLVAGNLVPADAILIDSDDLTIDLSTITGESEPVIRAADPVSGIETTRFFELPPVLPAGSAVVTGSAVAAIVSTGASSSFGEIAAMIQSIERGPSVLEQQVAALSRVTATIAVIAGAIVLTAIALTTETTTLEALTFATGVVVALVPEGLLPTLSISLAAAAAAMARRGAAVRRLSSVEIIGSATVICTDKTGTLTQNAINVAGFVDERIAGHPSDQALTTAVVCNDAHSTEGVIEGDPVDAALFAWARGHGADIEAIRERHPRITSVPFTAHRRYMMVETRNESETRVMFKGAPEAVGAAAGIESPQWLDDAVEDATANGFRVMVLASGLLGTPPSIVGLVLFRDPPRPEVPASIAACHSASIRIIMLTGDHMLTARAIANSVGLRVPETDIYAGDEIDFLNDLDLAEALRRDTVVARVDPSQKLRIVQVLRRHGDVVAVTGDGVNDAPALRAADVGVSMGFRGTEVAKQASDIVLGDDNFATIVAAIEEGRALKANIRRFVSYVFTSNVAELAPFVLYIFLPIPLPLSIMQVLAIDVGTDLVPALALGLEPASSGTMASPPEPPKSRLLTRSLAIRTFLFFGVIEAALGLGAFFLRYVVEGWRPFESLTSFAAVDGEAATLTFLGIVAGQIGCLFANRDGTVRDRLNLRTNLWMLWGLIFEVALTLALIYTPGLNGLFDMVAVHPVWLVILPAGAGLFVMLDSIRRAFAQRLARHAPAPGGQADPSPPKSMTVGPAARATVEQEPSDRP